MPESQAAAEASDGRDTAGDAEPPTDASRTPAHPPGATPAPTRGDVSLTDTSSGSGTDDGTPTVDYSPEPIDEAGRFRVLRPHARGGIGQVSVALDVELNREVALKEILPGRADDADSRARFCLEAEVTGHLEHPGIVPIYALGVGRSGRPFYVMRFVRGESLKDAIRDYHRAKAEGEPVLRRLLSRFLAACQAVAYAHSRGVIHRDLKPSNILLGPYGETLVVDWGLAKVIGRGKGAIPSLRVEDTASIEATIRPASGSSVSETLPGAAVGTPGYMSPEQAEGRNESLGPACDIYGLGATLYALLVGRAPIEGGDIVSALADVRRGEFPRPRSIDPRIDPALEAVCLKAMAVRPENRYASARELAEEVERWLSDEPVLARRDPPGRRIMRWARRHRGSALAAVAALVVATLAAGAAAVLIELARERESEARRGEKLASQRADREHQQVHAAMRRYQDQSARLALDRALARFDDDRAAEGMLWLGRALETIHEDDVGLDRVIRANLARGEGELRPMIQQIPQGGWVVDVAFSRAGDSLLSASRSGEAAVWKLATGARESGPWRHAGGVEVAAYAPDGKAILTAGWDGVARLWSADSGRPVGRPMTHAGRIAGAAFSPDGSKVATASIDRTARLWSATTGEPIGPPMTHDAPIVALAFASDGKAVATCGEDRTARVWSATDGTSLGVPMVHPAMVVDVAFRPDGRAIATAGVDGKARLWDLDRRDVVAEMPHRLRLSRVRFRPDGKALATASYDGTARLWSAASGEPIGSPMEHRSQVMSLAFSPDGSRLATGDRSGAARLWTSDTGERIGQPMEHGDAVWALAFRADGKALATASWDGTARAWDLIDPREPPVPPVALPSGINELAFSPDGKVLAIACEDGSVRLLDRRSGGFVGPAMKHDRRAHLCSFSRDGRVLVTAGYDGTARLWDAATGAAIGQPFRHEAPVYQALLSPDGRILATASEDKSARLWDTLTGRPLGPPLAHPSVVEDLAFRPDGRAIATGCWDGNARLWGVPDGKPIGSPMPHGDMIHWVAFSPDGTALATAGEDKAARVWDVATGRPRTPPLEHFGPVIAVAFRPDGKVVATASADGSARLWSAATGEPIGPPLEHKARLTRAAFSPDGRTLVTASEDGTARLWDTATGKPIAPPIRHEAAVYAAAFSPDGSAVCTAGPGRGVVTTRIPREVAGSPELIRHRVAALTGLDFEPGDALRRLSPSAWREERRAAGE